MPFAAAAKNIALVRRRAQNALCLLAFLVFGSTSGFAADSRQQSQNSQDELSQTTLNGKIALVTGSTDGLGREVALRLGEMGAHVIVHGRNEERGTEVVERINQGPGSASLHLADLASLQEVRELAETVTKNYSGLHILVNNAGIGSGSVDGERVLTEDGYELIFQVNYLSHFLLTELLLPFIQESAPARIVNVASGGQRPINFNDVMMERNYSAGNAYTQSKLAQILQCAT